MCPLCDQYFDADVSLDRCGDFIEDTKIITPEHRERDRLPGGAQKLEYGIATRGWSKNKPVVSLAYVST